jgi:DME family drug/metabolite transporter
MLGAAAVTLTSILWGTTGTAASFAPTVGPLAIGAAALGIGGMLQGVIAIPSLISQRELLRANWKTVVLGALAVGLYPLAFYSSMRLAGVAVGSVISLATAPLFSGMLERIIERCPLSSTWMLAAALGILGSVLLCVSDLASGAHNAHSAHGAGSAVIPGILLALVAGATYASYSWAVKHLLTQGLPRPAAMGSVFALGGVLLMPVLVLTGGPILASRNSLLVAVYMALIPMFLGYLLFGYGLARLEASTATTITLLEPAVAAVLAVLVVGERLSILGWVGVSLFAVVLILIMRGSSTQRLPSEEGDRPSRMAENLCERWRPM